MNQHERDLYREIVKADPECECKLIPWMPPTDAAPWTTATNPLAKAAIRDHLHTRLELTQYDERNGLYLGRDGGGYWAVRRLGRAEVPVEFTSLDKLNALLVAHAVRLGIAVPKEIDE